MNAKTVAIVEDEPITALELATICMEAGLQVVGFAATASKAWEKFSELRPDILITDMELADGSDGVEAVLNLRTLRPDMFVIFVTGAKMPETVARIVASSPDSVLNKPLDAAELRKVLNQTGS